MSVDLPTWTAFDPEAPGALPALPPSEGRALVLLASSTATEAGWGPGLAADLARALSRSGRRVVLADLGLVRPTLHEAFAEASGEGVTDAVRFGASPKRVARPIDGEAFFLVPAGTVVADAAETLESGRWASLCRGFVDAGVVLVIYLPEDEPGRAATLAVATDVVVLAAEHDDPTTLAADVVVPVRAVLGPAGGSAEPVRDEVGSTVPGLGDVEPVAEEVVTPVEPVAEPLVEPAESELDSLIPGVENAVVPVEPVAEPVPDGSESADGTSEELVEPTGEAHGDVAEPAELLPLVDVAEAPEDAGASGKPTTRHRSGTRTWLLLLLLLVVVAGALVAAWLGYIQIPGITPADGSAAVPVNAMRVPAAPPTPRSPVQGFSVAVAAYREAGAARAEAKALSSHAAGALVITVPIRIGASVMHRVLIGPARDSASASALADRVATDMNANDSRWIVRTTPLALRLGEMKEQAAADRRAGVLQWLGIPAYVMAVDFTDGSTRYRVYAGAFADTADASYLREQVQGRGLGDATLTSRIGRLPE